MCEMDYVIDMVWHHNAAEFYGKPMAMNLACMIINLLCECDKCNSLQRDYERIRSHI